MTPTFEELDAALTAYAKDDYLWIKFESTEDGILRFREYTFFMRFGLHMNKGVQAIMAHGHFLRIRSMTSQNSTFVLDRLDPSNHKACDYSEFVMSTSRGIWEPPEIHNILNKRMAESYKVMKENMARNIFEGVPYEGVNIGFTLFGQTKGSVPFQIDAMVEEAATKAPNRSYLHLRGYN